MHASARQANLAMAALCCLSALVLANAVSAQYLMEYDGPFDTAVELVTKSGTEIKFPYFSNGLKEIDPQLKKYLTQDINETLDFLYKIIGAQLDKKSSPGVRDTYTLTRAGVTMSSMVSKQNERRKKLQKKIGTRGAFNAYMGDVFNTLMYDSAHLTHQYEKLDHAALKRDLGRFIEDLKEALGESPVAMYVRFDEARWGDTSFAVETSRLMARLRTHGFGMVLKALGLVLSMIKKFGSSS